MTRHLAYLSLGTNLGNKEENLRAAMKLIEEQIGNIVSQSALYTSEPWGFTSENSFLNNVVAVSTTMTPEKLLETTQRIEFTLGRTRKSVNGQYADRLIDIDILFYDQQVTNTPTLTLPHPLMHRRLFVLEPLNQIAPTLTHPILKKDINTLCRELQEESAC
ncbi:MAG: 2-amino-4-hydroxy-6-hydroxymethyldihydropteridine diphosphokinase [Bacteroidaceae bacterium]|nr:2-amino-4-hydroxy-6-hydroxymethyldihydropteridine diphosphokinase [Bacteroidaceae bacterium]